MAMATPQGTSETLAARVCYVEDAVNDLRSAAREILARLNSVEERLVRLEVHTGLQPVAPPNTPQLETERTPAGVGARQMLGVQL